MRETRPESSPAGGTSTAVNCACCGREFTTRRKTIFCRPCEIAGTKLRRPQLDMYSWLLNNGPATAQGQLGFVAAGATGGKTDDVNRPDERGDHIWVWKNNTWYQDCWLVGQLGASWDDRWWDTGTRDFADFDLEIGQGYYYRHPTNYGAANFNWTPSLP